MRVCQFRHYGTINMMKGSAERHYDLVGHALLFGLQMDCNTRVWIIEWTVETLRKARVSKVFLAGLLRIAQGAVYILLFGCRRGIHVLHCSEAFPAIRSPGWF